MSTGPRGLLTGSAKSQITGSSVFWRAVFEPICASGYGIKPGGNVQTSQGQNASKSLAAVVVALWLSACGGKQGGDLEGTWAGPCQRDDGAGNLTDVACEITIGASAKDIFPVHIEAASGEVRCDCEGFLDGKVLKVVAPKTCSSSLGSTLAQYSVNPVDGKVDLFGSFGSGRTIVRFVGQLARTESKPQPHAGSEPSGGAPPPLAAPPRP